MAFPPDRKTWEVSKLVARTWVDNQFKQSFIDNPIEFLQEVGLTLEDFIEVQIKTGSYGSIRFVGGEGGEILNFQITLPPRPDTLDDEQLNNFINQTQNEIIVKLCC